MYKIFNFYEKYYKHDYYYLYIMSIIHVLLLFYTYIFQTEISGNTLVVLSFDVDNSTVDFINRFSFKNIFFISLIFIIDFIFLIILMKEFEQLKLNYYKIFLIEMLILFLSLSNPTIRNSMYFLSLNTLQITIVFKIIKYIPLGKLLFLSTAYIALIKLMLYPIIEYIKLMSVI